MARRNGISHRGDQMTMASTTRLASLDVLRGFDMLFIMGGEGLVSAVAAALGHPGFAASFGHGGQKGQLDATRPVYGKRQVHAHRAYEVLQRSLPRAESSKRRTARATSSSGRRGALRTSRRRRRASPPLSAPSRTASPRRRRTPRLLALSASRRADAPR